MPRKGTGTYPDDWPEIAKAVKDEAGWRCVRCGHPHDPGSGHMLGVHHLDMNKSNCAWHNVVCLCQKCHLQIQHKVVMERPWLLEHSEWMKPYAAGFYASIHGRDTSRRYVLSHIDELLDLGQPLRMP